MNVRLTKFERPLLLYAAALAVATIALFFIATKPLKEKIVAENDEIQKFYAKTENDQQKISQLPEFRNQSVMIGNDESKLRLMLPEGRVVDFIREVEGIAKSTGGTVTIAKGDSLEEIRKAMVPAPASTGDGKPQGKTDLDLLKGLPDGKTIGLTLTFSGAYADAVDFLHKVDTSPYFLDVLSLEIRPIDVEQDSGIVRTDVFSVSGTGTSTVVKKTPSNPKVEAVLSIVVYLE
ncbi:MAG: hypothetical protein HGA16_01350 [Candidatus Moranbacteria bacterium]|jgi:hypothetical protein|nr:hypothetical protein [Candidatus Moranbacteria bacterium]